MNKMINFVIPRNNMVPREKLIIEIFGIIPLNINI